MFCGEVSVNPQLLVDFQTRYYVDFTVLGTPTFMLFSGVLFEVTNFVFSLSFPCEHCCGGQSRLCTYRLG